MSKLKVTSNKHIQEKEYPELPFITKNQFGDYYMVCINSNGKYQSVDLDSAELIDDEFDTLDEYFAINDGEKIVDSELIIK